MRDFRFRRLEKYRVGGTRDQLELSYPVPRSPSGKIYQYSPYPEAAPRLFLIGDAPDERSIAAEHATRIRRQPGPGETVCPYSGNIGLDEDFVHFEDIRAIHKQIEHDAAADIQDHLAEMARDFNRKQPRGGLISMKMDVKKRHRPRPLAIREDLLRDLNCDVCRRAYAVYAIALFCPDCGAPNPGLHFRREAVIVREQITLADAQDAAGRGEIAYRLMGNAHEDVLTAFETTLKAIYRYLIRRHLPEQAAELCAKKAIGNAFQNIGRARERFAPLAIDPFAVLSDEELALLARNIEKRHVIGHNLGIADDHYVELTQAEQLGETVRLIGDEIGRFADICLAVVLALENGLLPDAQLPPASQA